MSDATEGRDYAEEYCRFGYPSVDDLIGLLTWQNSLDLSEHVIASIRHDEDLREEFFQLQSEISPDLGEGPAALEGISVWIEARRSGMEGLARLSSDPSQPKWVREWAMAVEPDGAPEASENSDWIRRAIEQSSVPIDKLSSWDRAARLLRDVAAEGGRFEKFEDWLLGRADEYDETGKIAISAATLGAHRSGLEQVKDQRPLVRLDAPGSESEIQIVVDFPNPLNLIEAVLVLRFRSDKTKRNVFVSTSLIEVGPSQWTGTIPMQDARVVARLRRVAAYVFVRTGNG